MALSSEITLVSYFSTAGAEVKRSPIVKLTLRSKICLVIIVAPTDSFKSPIIYSRFLRSTFFFTFSSKSSMVWSGLGLEKVISTGGGGEFFSSLHSPNLTFFGAA